MSTRSVQSWTETPGMSTLHSSERAHRACSGVGSSVVDPSAVSIDDVEVDVLVLVDEVDEAAVDTVADPEVESAEPAESSSSPLLQAGARVSVSRIESEK